MEKKEIKEVLQKFRKIFIQIGIFSFFINILMLSAPIYMLAVYDIVMPAKSLNTLALITAIIIVFFIAMGVLEYIRHKILIILSNKLDVYINKRIYHASFDMALKYPQKASAEAINDLNTIKSFISGQGLIAFFDLPWFPLYLAVLFAFSMIYGIYAIIAVSIIIVFTVINNIVTKKALSESMQAQKQSQLILNNQLRNAEVAEAMGMRENLFKRWLQEYHNYLLTHTDSHTKSAFYTNLTKSFRMMSSSLMYGIGAVLAIAGLISPGMIIAGAVLLGKALAPISQVVASWNSFKAAKNSYSRLNELLEEFNQIESKTKLPEPKGELKFENVIVVSPLNKLPILKNINIDIKAGEIVGIIGPSGAGKSTFLKTALGLWKVTSGSVMIDKADINQYNKDELGKYIGYLPQDIELFDGTIAENIARFEMVDDEKIIKAAKLAGVHDMIVKFPDGYNTYVGVGGFNLSGGQRQRVALARAVFGNPKLVLLDEPNSNLDIEGEKALIKCILELKNKKVTTIFITHKNSLLHVSTKIAILKDNMLLGYDDSNKVLQQLNKGQ